jgi:hypothetical protein
MVIERFANIAQNDTILFSGLEVMEQWENNTFKHPSNVIPQYIFAIM